MVKSWEGRVVLLGVEGKRNHEINCWIPEKHARQSWLGGFSVAGTCHVEVYHQKTWLGPEGHMDPSDGWLLSRNLSDSPGRSGLKTASASWQDSFCQGKRSKSLQDGSHNDPALSGIAVISTLVTETDTDGKRPQKGMSPSRRGLLGALLKLLSHTWPLKLHLIFNFEKFQTY